MTTLTEMTQIRDDNARTEREYQFSEARWLMSFGTHPDWIAVQLGTTRRSLERKANRWGADDIAAYVHETRQQTKGRCVDCGVETSRKESRRCVPCSVTARYGQAA